jgi:hypothetical protein
MMPGRQKNIGLLVVLLAAPATAQTATERKVFALYPATHIALPTQRPKAIIHPDDRTFRTRLSRITEGKSNFADHSRIEVWGCGSGCFSFGIADLTTGNTYYFPKSVSAMGSGRRLMFDRHSSALHVVGIFNEKKPADRWYVWNGRSLLLRKDIPLPAACFDLPGDTETLLATARCNFQPAEEQIGPSSR